jgi:methionyl-tRNA synthetase
MASSESYSRRTLLAALAAASGKAGPPPASGKAGAGAAAAKAPAPGKAPAASKAAPAVTPAAAAAAPPAPQGRSAPAGGVSAAAIAPLCGESAPASVRAQQFYLTTAINYTNGAPHLGHAYEAVTSDVICRYHRAFGRDVFFLTGSDEHGQKVEKAAQTAGVTPQQIADRYSDGFKALNAQLKISNDFYIRTTSGKHKELVRKIWERVRAAGDIYLKDYVGWYNVHEEQYVTDKEAEERGYKDEHGRPYERKSEESYFFRMGKYQEQLVRYISEENPQFIQPEARKREMLSFLSEPLQDLCVTRTVCQWGVQCPKDPEYRGDKNHVMYVWFDALSNYLSGVNYLCGAAEDPANQQRFWPANVHVVGKDIVRFHTIIWPAMLMSAKVPLPKTVFGHGFVVAADGVKMSKSLGNVVDPVELLALYPSDSVRFYIAAGAPYGADMPFSADSLCSMHNATLKSGLGNLVHRVTSLCAALDTQGCVPADAPHPLPGQPTPFDLKNLKTIFEVCFSERPARVPVPADFSAAEFPSFLLDSVRRGDGLQLSVAALALVEAINSLNKYVQTAEPWKLKAPAEQPLKRAIVRAALEGAYAVAHFLQPFCPDACAEVFNKVGVRATCISCLQNDFRNLPPGAQTHVGPVLFDELAPGVGKVVAGGAEKAKEDRLAKIAESVAAKKERKEAARTAGAIAGDDAEADPDRPEFTKLDLRVGKIVKVWHHESADKLFCEEIDVGDEEPRKIASGLREHYQTKDLEGRLVVVLCNLKPRKLAGFESNGMVICATSPTKVEMLDPPKGAKVGERLALQGVDANKYAPEEPNRVAKKKIWESVAPMLLTNASKQATWDGQLIVTSQGALTVPTLANVNLA